MVKRLEENRKSEEKEEHRIHPRDGREQAIKDFDDDVSIAFPSPHYDDGRISKKKMMKEKSEKDKRLNGLFGFFSKVDPDRRSTYESDDNDARSTISSSSRREKGSNYSGTKGLR
ncbi:hypothetical protein GQ44DRAFT_758360 [Phaeosphaeriaceae sp. PMI808]|nr:hypothetical protein GQ44DRAFT_758360 [Phaeosphaeriaceae sp. PMI808]